ncbi:Uncharacterised protein [Listeria grayi]|uniref:Uncharacterized protein n=1 Tax=Listeria grayi TaxID=1641 RepID=A0A378MA70_LISGR|nr:Uncharacterised protein [Listeria grayi]
MAKKTVETNETTVELSIDQVKELLIETGKNRGR